MNTNIKLLILTIALSFIAIGAMVAAVIKNQPKEEPAYKKVATTQIAGNGGLIDGYEYRAKGIVCFVQIQVVPNMTQTYSSVTMDCVHE